MGRILTEEHKAAMQAGRIKASEDKARDTERRKAAYSVWSKANAALHLAWKDNCGRLAKRSPDGWVRCDCEWCKPYRESNAAMPDMRGIEDDG